MQNPIKFTRSAIAVLSVAGILTGGAIGHATLIDVKTGADTNDASADGAYVEGAAVFGSAGSFWNEYKYVSTTPFQVSIVDDTGATLPGVTLTITNSGGVGAQTNSGSNPAFLFASEPYQNPGGIFTMSLAGLTASTTYEFIGYA